eukprot:INCI15407.2.p1 GENE.INCI15407.2~~INCI15407.2.p1  ORF type:complete len:552 (-),score=103.05 INCI15407.2:1148-2803(-)
MPFFAKQGLRVQCEDTPEKKKGRCLVAARAFPAGAELFRNEPVAAVANQRDVCSVCMQCISPSAATTSFCSGCRTVQYCGPVCQRVDWPQHKRECACLKSTLPKKATPNVLLLTRVVRLLHIGGELTRSKKAVKRRFGSVACATAEQCRQVFDELQNHRAQFDSDTLLTLRFVASLAQKILTADPALASFVASTRSGSSEPMPADVTREGTDADSVDANKMRAIDAAISLLCQLRCNCHTVCDEELVERGIGLYAAGAVVNHSCAPSAVVLYHGTTQVFRTLRRIETGEEVTIAYVDLAQPGRLRRQKLKQGYFFQCQCQRCANPTSLQRVASGLLVQSASSRNTVANISMPVQPQTAPDLTGNDTAGSVASRGGGDTKASALAERTPEISTVATFLEAAAQCHKSGSGGEEGFLRQALVALDQAGCGPAHYQRLDALGRLQANLIDHQRFEAAYTLARELTAALDRTFAQRTGSSEALAPSPVLGLQYYKHGKLAWYLGRCHDALDALQKAARILCVSHGAEFAQVRELLRLLDEVQAEIQHLGSGTSGI